MTDLTTVQYAILETNGSISTLLYPKHQPATAKDAGIHVDALQLPVTLISGGRLLHENLRLAGRTEAWVKEQLSHYHCAVRDVYLLTAEPSGMQSEYLCRPALSSFLLTDPQAACFCAPHNESA